MHLDDNFDAVVGRFVLMYPPHPAAALRNVLGPLRPNGLAIFYECNLLAGLASFIDAGLPPPQLHANNLIIAGSEQTERFAPYVANLL